MLHVDPVYSIVIVYTAMTKIPRESRPRGIYNFTKVCELCRDVLMEDQLKFVLVRFK